MPENSSENYYVPPSSVPTEQAILGILLSNPESFFLMEPMLSPVDFYGYANRQIFEAISRLTAENKPADVLTVFDYLRSAGHEKETGGLQYLNSLVEAATSAVNLSGYADIVKDKALKRGLLSTVTKLEAELSRKQNVPAIELIDEAQATIMRLTEDGTDDKGFVSSGTLADELADYLIKAANMGEVPKGAESGIPELDMLTKGFKPGQLIVLAARPSIGKSAFALQVSRNAALHQKKPVAFFSLEMSKEDLIRRIVAAEGGIDASALDSGLMSQKQWRTFYEICEHLKSAPLYIDDTGLVSLFKIKSKARQLKARISQLGLIVIDYLQLIEEDNSEVSAENRALQLGALSRGLKLLAKELGVPILLLSQLNRGIENRPSHRPLLSDLRESGAIEQDADMVILMYSLARYGAEQGDSRTIYLNLAKNRNGSVGEVAVIFNGDLQRFEEINAWR